MKKLLLAILLLTSTITGLNNETNIDAKSINPELNSYVNINEVDSFNNVVIFIKFADETNYTAPYGLSYYQNLFNGEDTISLRDYYLEASYGKLEINSILTDDGVNIIFYQDTYNRDYYQPYDETYNTIGYEDDNSSRIREHNLLKRAVDYVEDNNLIPDETNLDANNDGDIDSISFLISGEDDGWMSLFWPHKWELTSFYDFSNGAYKPEAPTINGKYAYTYTFELLGNSTNYSYQVDVAVLAHETFHLISAPDLYHYYRYDWIEPVGNWGLMESLGTTPSHMLGYMKEVYGKWITNPTVIDQNGTYTLYPLQNSENNLYKIDTGYSNESVYIEYRDHNGDYEATLPNTGLIVYRVDNDYFDWGNVDGYYNEEGLPQDEVFIFRPNIPDILPPIEFPVSDHPDTDEDGLIDNAALSQYNEHDEMGLGTSIQMFHSDGTLMNITIYDVYEYDGYITFKILFDAPEIKVVNDYGITNAKAINFVNMPNTFYEVTIDNLPTTYDAYYTLDGSTPDESSPKWDGSNIEISATNNNLKVAMYFNGSLVGTIEETFTFVDLVETNHILYGNNIEEYWYLNFQDLTKYSIDFNTLFQLEDNQDFIHLYTDLVTSNTYTNNELRNVDLEYTNNSLMIKFVTNDNNNVYYGFKAVVKIDETFTSGLGYYLTGDSDIYIELEETYIEQGITFVGTGSEDAYFTTTTTLNNTEIGTYLITYSIYNGSDELIGTATRNIHVGDYTKPVVTLNGEQTIYVELNGEYTELGATATDNYPLSNSIIIDNRIDATKVGSYVVYYFITDDAGNRSDTVTRTVIVQDTTTPTVTLKPSVDTIIVNDNYSDPGIEITGANKDLYTKSVTSTVDTSTAGTYIITYTLTSVSGDVITVKRYVTVLEKPIDETFGCYKSQTTFRQDESIVVPQCMLDGIYTPDVDLSQIPQDFSGIYHLPMRFTVNGIDLIYYKVIWIIPNYDFEIALVPEKRRDLV